MPDCARGRRCLLGGRRHSAPRRIDIRVDTKVVGVARHGNGVAVDVIHDGAHSQIVGSHLLLAIGRRPNTDDLGLDTAGIAVDERGFIKVGDRLCTNVSGVWAMGDCNGRGAFTHTSYNDFEIIAANILDQARGELRIASRHTRCIPTRRWAVSA